MEQLILKLQGMLRNGQALGKEEDIPCIAPTVMQWINNDVEVILPLHNGEVINFLLECIADDNTPEAVKVLDFLDGGQTIY